MRAHRQRRLIWLADAALAAGCAALVAWIFLDVRPAAASSEMLRPPYVGDVMDDYGTRPVRRGESLRPPVSSDEILEIDRDEFRVGDVRFHWLYSGPTPPPPPEAGPVAEAEAKIEDDLARLGRVRLLVYIPPPGPDRPARETVVTWEFADSRERLAFTPGEFIRPRDAARTGGIRLVDVTPIDRIARRYAIHYAVHATDDEPPVKTAILAYDAEVRLDPGLEERILPPAPRTSPPPPRPDARPRSTGTGRAAPLPDPTTLRPIVTRPAPNRVDVAFDPATYDYFRRVDPDALAKTVKTEPARNAKGKVLGVRITGITPGSPLERFAVKPGDIVVSIDDHPVKSNADALNLVQGLDPDVKRVKVVIDRYGRLITFTIDPSDPKTRRDARALAPR